MKISENYSRREAVAQGVLNHKMKKDRGFYRSNTEILSMQNFILNNAGKGLEDLEEVKLDAQVSSAIDLRGYNILKLKYDIDRGSEKNFYSKWVKDIMQDWDMSQIIKDVIDSRGFGFSVLEYKWQQESSFLVIKKLCSVPSYYFNFDVNNLLHFKHKDYDNKKICSSYNFLLIQNHPTENNPYGESLLAKCYWDVIFKKGEKRFWAEFSEKYGQPMLYGKVNSNTKPQIAAMAEMLENLRNGGVAVTMPDDSIDLLKGNDMSSPEIYKSLIDHCNDEITKVWLSHNSAMDATAGELGNTSKAQTTMDIIAMADKQLVEQSIQKVINLMIEVNFGKIDSIPKFEMYEEKDVDMEQALRDKTLTETGIEFFPEYYQEVYGLKKEHFRIKPKTAAPGSMFSESKYDYTDVIDNRLLKYVEKVKEGNSYSEIKKSLLAEFSSKSDDEIADLMKNIILFTELDAEKTEKELQSSNFSIWEKLKRVFK